MTTPPLVLPATPEPPRVTLKTIAAAAGCSVMTVSYALRGSPEVSQRQRERIRKLAQKLGYRPDPLLSHLMAHLRETRGTPKTSENLALITMAEPEFVSRIIKGARGRAEQLGYTLDRIDPASAPTKAKLTRMLLARGVAGIVLTPAREPGDYHELLDWQKFATAAIGHSFIDLPVSRVVSNHFENAHRVFARLHERGFRRIGLVMMPDMEPRSNHNYSGAYCRLAEFEGYQTMPVLIFTKGNQHELVPRWFTRWRPDAVVLASSAHLRESIAPYISAARLRATTFACLDYAAEDGVPGIDQCYPALGTKAVDVVVGQILRNERGLPQYPTITMLNGHWREGQLISTAG